MVIFETGYLIPFLCMKLITFILFMNVFFYHYMKFYKLSQVLIEVNTIFFTNLMYFYDFLSILGTLSFL